MTQENSPDYLLKRWYQQAARHPGFIGYGLALLRERTGMTEERQRTAVGLPLAAAYDPVWLHLQAMEFPRREMFEQDTRSIAEYVAQKALEEHHLEVSLNAPDLLVLLIEARAEMAVKVTSRQPFAITVPGGGMYIAEAGRHEYRVYLPEGVDACEVSLHVAPTGGATLWRNGRTVCGCVPLMKRQQRYWHLTVHGSESPRLSSGG